MSRGSSGRVVVEIDPEVKNRLYAALVKDKLTLKDWFLMQCQSYVSEAVQPSLFSSVIPEKGSTEKHHE